MVAKRKRDPQEDHSPSDSDSSMSVRPRTKSTTKNPAKKRRTVKDTLPKGVAASDTLKEFIVSNSEEEDMKPVKRASKTRTKAKKCSHPRPHRPRRSHRQEFLAELADLEDASVTSTSRRTTRAAAVELSASRQARSSGEEDVKPVPKSKAIRHVASKSRHAKELDDELADLLDTNNDSHMTDIDSEDEDETSPRCHSRVYKPAQPGVQNIPWSDLPGEIRNRIYQYAMANDNGSMVNVHHYPKGIPRRSERKVGSSSSLYAWSYWGFTQVNQQIRREFTPWLLEVRRVRTPLATLNNYVDTFHQPLRTGERIGWVEPITNDAPLSGNGVEVQKLLRHAHENRNFHLQLTPSPIFPNMVLLPATQVTSPTDELSIMKKLGANYEKWSKGYGVRGVRITSSMKKPEFDLDSIPIDDEKEDHDILIHLAVNIDPTHSRDSQLHSINRFIWRSRLHKSEGIRIQADVAGGVAMWTVVSSGVVDLYWKESGKGRRSVSIHLTKDASGFTARPLIHL
jgi:hypothetical protein